MVRITLKKCLNTFSSNTRVITEARFAINPTSRQAFEDGSILTDWASLHITGPSISIVPCKVRACSFVLTQLATLISTGSNFVQVLSRPVTVQCPVDSWRTTLHPQSSLSSTGINQDNAQTQNLWCSTRVNEDFNLNKKRKQSTGCQASQTIEKNWGSNNFSLSNKNVFWLKLLY